MLIAYMFKILTFKKKVIYIEMFVTWYTFRCFLFFRSMIKSGNTRSADGISRGKYSALKQDEGQSKVGNDGVTDKSPLLENIENMNISCPKNISTERKIPTAHVKMEGADGGSNGRHAEGNVDECRESNTEPNNGNKNDTAENIEEKSGDTFNEKSASNSTRPKTQVNNQPDDNGQKTSKIERQESIDIMRRMSENSITENYIPWQKIGSYQNLKVRNCQRLYAASGSSDDIALFFRNGRFYAMEAWCTHMGGPLYQGDIEDYNGRGHVMCPWHSYMFDLETGNNEIGLKQKVYDLKYAAGSVWVRYHCPLTTEPVNRKLSQDHNAETKQISIEKVKARKKSVLDTPFSLT
ncbi:hypothetical protein ACF0H5_018129 [Mactra antiquata]